MKTEKASKNSALSTLVRRGLGDKEEPAKAPQKEQPGIPKDKREHGIPEAKRRNYIKDKREINVPIATVLR